MGEISRIPQTNRSELIQFGSKVTGSGDAPKKRQQEKEDSQKQEDSVELHEDSEGDSVKHLDNPSNSPIIHLDISA